MKITLYIVLSTWKTLNIFPFPCHKLAYMLCLGTMNSYHMVGRDHIYTLFIKISYTNGKTKVTDVKQPSQDHRGLGLSVLTQDLQQFLNDKSWGSSNQQP